MEIWNKTNEALSRVSGAQMTDYVQIEEGVSVTTYSNGVKIYVNHTDKEHSVDGVTVAAKSYVIGG